MLPSEIPEADLSLYKFVRDEKSEIYYIYRSSVQPALRYNIYYTSLADVPGVGKDYDVSESIQNVRFIINSRKKRTSSTEEQQIVLTDKITDHDFLALEENNKRSRCNVEGEAIELAHETPIGAEENDEGFGLDIERETVGSVHETLSEVKSPSLQYSLSSTRLPPREEKSQLVIALDIECPRTLPRPVYLAEWLDLAAPETQQSAFMDELDAEEAEEEEDIISSDLQSIAGIYEVACKPNGKSMLRHFIPEDIHSEVVKFYNGLPQDMQTLKGWTFATNVVEWRHMAFASSQLRLMGLYKHVPLQQAESFNPWQSSFRSETKWPVTPAQTLAAPPVSLVDSDEQESGSPSQFHHLNFLGERIFERSATPPEVSLWAAITSERFAAFRPLSRRGVITSQATKFIDSFSYTGPEHLLGLSGTELRDSVIGYVEKVYSPVGTWLQDKYNEDDDIVKTTEEVAMYWDNRDSRFENLQRPYLIEPCDDDAFHLSSSKYGQRYSGHGPSKLRQTQISDEFDKIDKEADRPPTSNESDTTPKLIDNSDPTSPQSSIGADTPNEEVYMEWDILVTEPKLQETQTRNPNPTTDPNTASHHHHQEIQDPPLLLHRSLSLEQTPTGNPSPSQPRIPPFPKQPSNPKPTLPSPASPPSLAPLLHPSQHHHPPLPNSPNRAWDLLAGIWTVALSGVRFWIGL